jgi:hypothetical protein
MTRKKTSTPNPRRRRVGKLRGGKGGWEPRSEIVDRAERVVTLQEQGWTQDAIAREVGVSQPAVSKLLQRLDRRALAALDQELASHKMRRLRILEYVSREGRRAWEHSKQGRVRKRQRKATSPSGAPVVTHEILVDEQPDPRMLDQARKAEEVLAEVCGFTGAAARGGRALAEPAGRHGKTKGVLHGGQDAAASPSVVTSDDLKELSLDELKARAQRFLETIDTVKGGGT